MYILYTYRNISASMKPYKVAKYVLITGRTIKFFVLDYSNQLITYRIIQQYLTYEYYLVHYFFV